jgi:hypothetical protein
MAFLQRNGTDDFLFPQSESGQTRFAQMSVAIFNGANASGRMAEFIRLYKNRDGTIGLPPTHIGATSPYIDAGNIFYIYYNNNVNTPFIDAMFANAADVHGDGSNVTVGALNTARLTYIVENKTLLARLQGSDTGWRS